MNTSPTQPTEIGSSSVRRTWTVPRCHLAGSLTSIALILGIFWVWSLRCTEVSTIAVGPEEIDLNEAAALLENAEHWRRLYTVNYRASQAVDRRSASIAAWLPRSVPWTEVETAIQSLGRAADLNILSIKRTGSHDGIRVGVVAATCQVRGTYASLCRFLAALTEPGALPAPMACNEITLHRVPGGIPGREQPAQLCRATLSLRIPLAAKGTAAGRLLLEEVENEI